MCAFVVHDLKNLVAQLSLMLRNAERHGANPEFQKDMLHTVGHVVKRMHGLLLQLRPGSRGGEPADIDVRRSRAAFGGRAGLSPASARGEAGVRARERRAPGARVSVTCCRMPWTPPRPRDAADRACRTTGRSRPHRSARRRPGHERRIRAHALFQPFYSTKSAGMGIGAYESQQYVTSSGAASKSTAHRARAHDGCAGADVPRWAVVGGARAPADCSRRIRAPRRKGRPMSQKRRPLLIVEDDPALQRQMAGPSTSARW